MSASRFRANPDAPDNPYSRAQNPVHCDPGHGHPKRPVSLVEARELGPESVGRLSILCNHSLSRSKLLKQLRFLFFQRARGSRWKSGCSSFEARQRVAARATELGIPQHFQPSLHVYWLSRGRDGLKKIRAALSTVNTQKFGTLNF